MTFAQEDLKPFAGYDNFAVCVRRQREGGLDENDAIDVCEELRDQESTGSLETDATFYAPEFKSLLRQKSLESKIARSMLKAASRAQNERVQRDVAKAMTRFFKDQTREITKKIFAQDWTPDPERATSQAARLVKRAFDQEKWDEKLVESAGQPLADAFLEGAIAEVGLNNAAKRRKKAAKYSDDQSRDESGRWSGSGGGDGGASTLTEGVQKLYTPERLESLQTHDGKRASEMTADEYVEAIGGYSEDAQTSMTYDEKLSSGYEFTEPGGAFTAKDGAEYELRVGQLPRTREGIYAFSKDQLEQSTEEDRGWTPAVGYIRIEKSMTYLAVADEHSGKGLGLELMYRLRSVAPFQPSGGLSNAGIKLAKKVHAFLKADGKSVHNIVTKDAEDFDDEYGDDIDFPTTMPDWLREAAQDFILEVFEEPYWQAINQTTRDDIQLTLYRAIEDGLSIRDIAKQIQEHNGAQYSRARATMVARTESGAAMNFGHRTAIERAYEDTGLEAAAEWLSILGTTTRPTHAEADGQQRPLDQPFIVGGYECRFPGDFSLPPEERISCQCTILSALVGEGIYDDEGAEERSFDPDQPRDESGRWAGSGGGGGGGSAATAEDGGQDTSEGSTAKVTDTPEFKTWFKESKVVDASGDPKETHEMGRVMKVYHGTQEEFSTFDPSKIGERGGTVAGNGFYFAENKAVAEAYSQHGGKIIEAYLSIQNPFDFDSRLDIDQMRTLAAALKDSKDGVDPGDTEKEIIRAFGKKTDAGTKDITGLDAHGALIRVFGRSRVNEVLADAGYDGISHLTEDRAGTPLKPDSQENYGRVWVAFAPTQIKSTDNDGTFDPNNPNINKTIGESSNPQPE